MKFLLKAAIAVVITGISYGVSAEGGWHIADPGNSGYVESQYMDSSDALENSDMAKDRIKEFNLMEPTAAGPTSEQTGSQAERAEKDSLLTEMLRQGGHR